MSLLGFDAIGRFALGQTRQSSGLTLAALSGSFAFSASSISFKISETTVAGSYVLTGNAASLNESEAAASGSFAFSGVATSFKFSEKATSGAYSFVGVSIGITVTEPETAGTFFFTGSPASFGYSFSLAPGSYRLIEQPIFVRSGMDALGSMAIGQITPGKVLQGEHFATVMRTESAVIKFTASDAPLIRTGFDYEFQQGGVGHYLYERETARRLAAITRPTPRPIDRRTMPRMAPLPRPYSAPIAPAPVVPPVQPDRMAVAAAQAQATKKRRDIEALLLLAS